MLLALFSIYFIQAQERIVMPPSATPASLAKYIDNPVSFYTGVPDIKIPLWTINLKKYKLPIQLSYHAGGVKVEEEASPVGLNWSLAAGGVITRAVRDIPDDYNKGETIKMEDDRPFDIPVAGNYPRLGRFWSGKYEVLRDFNSESTDNSYAWTNLDRIKSNYTQPRNGMFGMNDLEPDIFYFNFGNKSGKFVFDVEGNIQTVALIPYQDLKITHTLDANGKIASFTIVDNDGTEYLFSSVETLQRISESTMYSLGEHLNPDGSLNTGGPSMSTTITVFNSSWFLTSIKTIYDETVTFSYVDERLSQRDGPTVGRSTGKYPNGAPYLVDNYYTTSMSTSFTRKRISKIETNNEIVTFYATLGRDDMVNDARAITAVDVVKKSTGKTIKSFLLNYTYFTSPAAEAANVGAGLKVTAEYIASTYNRLRLDRITESGDDDKSIPPYVFQYDVSSQLPNRFSMQQDVWGYFNGAISNTTLIPTVYQYASLNGSDRFRVYKPCYTIAGEKIHPAADRMPSPTKMTAGTLVGITYPTGGRVAYEYEPNTFRYENCNYIGGGIRIKSIKNYRQASDVSPALTRSYQYDNPDGSTNGRIISLPVFAEPDLANTKYYSYSRSMLGLTSGSAVGYRKVIERSGGSNNGYTVYEYSMPAIFGESTDQEYGLFNVSKVKWIDNIPPTNSNEHNEFLAVKNDHHLSPNTAPFPPNPDYDWNRGRLLKQSFFDSAGTLKSETIHTYNIYDGSNTTKRKKVFGLVFSSLLYDLVIYNSVLIYSKYEYLTNMANVLTSTTTKNYSSAGVISSTESYNYAGVGHMNMTEKTTYTSKGDKLITKYKFPFDYSANSPQMIPKALTAMASRNLISVPLEVMNYKEVNNQRQLLSAQFTEYNVYSNKFILPQKHFATELTAPLTDFSESFLANQQFVHDARYKEKLIVNSYDELSNPLQLTENQQEQVSYLWGESKVYPIAEAKNASMNDIAYTSFETTGNGNWGVSGAGIIQSGSAVTGDKYLSAGQNMATVSKSNLDPAKKYQVSMWFRSALGATPGNGFVAAGSPNNNGWTYYHKIFDGQATFTFNFLRSEIDELRLLPVSASMVTSVYDPFVGLKSIADSRGQVTRYEYDNFQRLQVVRDNHGDVKQMTYYKYIDPSEGGVDIFTTSFETESIPGIISGMARTGNKSFDGDSEDLPPTAMFFQKRITGLYTGKYGLSWWRWIGNQWVNQEIEIVLTGPVTSNSYTITLPGLIDDVRFYYKGKL
jgi:YD repeat-containing protein